VRGYFWDLEMWLVGSPPAVVSGLAVYAGRNDMIVLGVILILLGLLLDVGILYTLGAILAVVGLVLWILGALGRQIGPRAHYY
jgi:hypothetical protein